MSQPIAMASATTPAVSPPTSTAQELGSQASAIQQFIAQESDAQTSEAQTSDNGCPIAVLEQLSTHTVETGETVDSIATSYGLLPTSIVAFNPPLQQQGSLRGGDRIQIPPYDGSIQTVIPGSTWQTLADQYRIRADVLFETNGCTMTPPNRIFVPGTAAQIRGETWIRMGQPDPLTFDLTPIADTSVVVQQYGWQERSALNHSGSNSSEDLQLVFHPGIDFLVPMDTAVQTVGAGTVAFVGDKDDYGLLIVINHAQGIQTRYAQLSSAQVSVGDRVSAGQTIGQSGQSGSASRPHLHFEVRLNSDSGWLAQDPLVYLNSLER